MSLVHSPHNGVGCTDLPSVALRQQLEHLERVLAYCDTTPGHPSATRFQSTIGTSRPLSAWLESRGLLDVQLQTAIGTPAAGSAPTAAAMPPTGGAT